MNAMPKLYMVTGHGELELDSAFYGHPAKGEYRYADGQSDGL